MRKPTEKPKEGVLEHRSLSNDGFNSEGCLRKLGQQGRTEKLKHGALKHTRSSKEAFHQQVSGEAQQGRSRLSKEAFINQSSEAFSAGCLWNFWQTGPSEKLKQRALEQRSLSNDCFNTQLSYAFSAGCLWKFGQLTPREVKGRSSRRQKSEQC